MLTSLFGRVWPGNHLTSKPGAMLWRALGILILLCNAGLASAASTPWEWTSSALPNQVFPSQGAALEASWALGLPYSLATNLERTNKTEEDIRYTYGAEPRDPTVGEWGEITTNQGWSMATEPEAVARAIAERTHPPCQQAIVTPRFMPVPQTSDWYSLHTWLNSGISDHETRFYNWEAWTPNVPGATPPCLHGSGDNIQFWKQRVVACPLPPHLTWDGFTKQCEKHNILTIIGPPTPCPVNEGNPCDAATGDKSQTEFDLSLPWINFERHYRSITQTPGGKLGWGWTHSFNRQLAISGVPTGRITANGNQIPMRKPLGVTGDIYEESTGSNLRVVKLPGSDEWLFLSSSGDREYYSQLGRLLRIQRADGRTQTMTYDAFGNLSIITDSSGRTLSLIYTGSPKRLQSLWVNGVPYVNYSYSAQDNLASVSYASGGIRNYHYENSALPHHLTGITDENGARYSTYAYDPMGRATSTQHAGGAGLHTLDYNGNTTTVTLPLGGSRVYTFTNDGNFRMLLSLTENGVLRNWTRATFINDFRRRVSQSTDLNGNVTNYAYSDIGSIRTTTRTEAVGTPDQRVVSIDTDLASGRTVAMGQPGHRTSYVYNNRGQQNVVCERDAGIPAALTYSCGSATHAPIGVRQSVTTYCEAADVAAPGSTCPLLGLIKSTDGPRIDVADTVSFTYRAVDDTACAASQATCTYRKGDLWKVTNALGQISEYLTYDGAGRVKRMKDANGVITDMSYHGRGWLQTRTVRANANGAPNAALDAVTTLNYDDVGQVVLITQPDGVFVEYGYDDAHRLTDITDNLGNTLSYTLDAAGNRTAENTRDPSNTLTRTLGRVYDSLVRLDKLLNAQTAETDFDYDNNGNQTSVTDALLRETVSTIDPLNRLIQSTDALMGNTQYRYDARDNLTKVIDAKGLATDYVYNGLSDLVQLISPDTGTTHYTYDSAGNRATQTDARGVTSTYSYDVLNRLTGIAYPASSNNVAFTYDQNHIECDVDEQFGVGRLTGFTDPSGSTKLCYDLRGNVKRKIAVVNGNTLVTKWSYNTADRVIQMTYPSELQVDYARDDLGRIIGIHVSPGGASGESLINNVTYYPFGPVRQIEWGNGSTSTRSYDQNYWIDRIDSSQADGLDLEFTLDAVGNITGLSDVLGGTPPGNTYIYDELDRLSDVAVPGGSTVSYTYDVIGNRTSKLFDGFQVEAYSYTAGTHHLENVSGIPRTYDQNGNTLTTSNPYSYPPFFQPNFQYDQRNRLKVVLQHQKGIIYSHNARGERVTKESNSQVGMFTTFFYYDEAGRLIGETNETGKLRKEFIWLDDLPVGVFARETLHYVQPDHLGSPRKVIATRSDSAIWSWPILNNPFGEAGPNEDPDGDSVAFTLNLRFPGQYYDDETGLHYNYFRDYEPATGRYVESDPIGLSGGISSYSYAEGNSLRYIDFFGLSARDVQKIREIFKDTTKQMTDEGLRHPDPSKNNRCRKWPWFWGCPDQNKYMDCGEQTEYMHEPLRAGSYDDMWFFYTDSGVGHAWGIGASSNPEDPLIFYDTRADEFSTGIPCPSCKPWLFFRSLYENGPPMPPLDN